MEDLEDEREGLVTGLDISRRDIIARVNALKLFAFVAATFAIVLLVALLVIVIHDADTSHSTSSTSASSTGTLGLSKLECSLIRSRPDGPTGDFYFYREMHEQTEGQFADVVHVMGALTVHKATHKQKSFAVHILQANIFDNSDIPKSLKIYNPMRKAHACPPTPERETGSLVRFLIILTPRAISTQIKTEWPFTMSSMS